MFGGTAKIVDPSAAVWDHTYEPVPPVAVSVKGDAVRMYNGEGEIAKAPEFAFQYAKGIMTCAKAQVAEIVANKIPENFFIL